MAISDMPALSTLGLTAILVFLTWRFFVYPSFFSPLHKIPAIRTDWKTRCYAWIYQEPRPPQLVEWLRMVPNHGLVRYPGIGGAERVLLTSPEAIREVMVTKRYEYFQRPKKINQIVKDLFGEGLLTSEGDVHRMQKRALAPVFLPRVVKDLYPLFWRKACELTAKLERDLGSAPDHDHVNAAAEAGRDLELVDWISSAALDIIGVTVWGRDFDGIANPHSQFVQTYERILRPGSAKARRQAQLLYTASLLVPMNVLSKWFPCEFFREKAMGIRAVRQACTAALASRRQALANGATEGKDILSHIMTSIQGIDDETLQGHLMNFLAAGHGTVSLTVTWLCYFLAKHPTVQTKLQKELDAILVDRPSEIGENSAFDPESLAAMPYLRAVMRETLRMRTIVPIFRREATKDTTIAGYSIPAGSILVCAPWVSHMQEEQWGPDAMQFNPDRWSYMEASSLTYSYMPFSVGPRACIGEGFAKAEVLVLVAALVRSFSFALSDVGEEPPKILWGTSASPVGLRLRVQPRGNSLTR